MKKYLTLLLLLLPLLSQAAMKSSVITISDWRFSKDGVLWETVTVPHSCNGQDGRSPRYYRGETRYLRDFSFKEEKVRFLRFEGAAQKSRVYVNGSLVSEHRGGYTPFVVALPSQGEARVEVVCDNTMDPELIPVHSDFNKNNGLLNPVRLLELPSVYFDPDDYGPSRLRLTHNSVSANRAEVLVQTKICNVGGKNAGVHLRLALKDAEGKAVWSAQKQCKVPAGGSLEVEQAFSLENPHLWDGIFDPYLYTFELSLSSGDSASVETGFRWYSIDRYKGFRLNGHIYPLRGVSMHQDLEGKAGALSDEDIAADYAIVKELGCNFLRLAHYPHNEEAFRWCDRMGIIVQTEIPWVNVCGERATPAYFENIHSQMHEMITSLYNHPSIVFWGMWNELDNWGNKPEFQGKFDARRVVDETSRLYAYAKSLDKTRFVGLTDDSQFKRDFYTTLQADYYSENRYYGWYYTPGDFTPITPLMHWIRDNMGPANISEYGVGVNPWCHTWKEEDIRRYKDDSRHPEEYGNLSHESHVQQIARMPWLNFTSLWILFDFPVADRKEGWLDSDDGVNYIENPDRLYLNDKGLVTRDRKLRKDTFYLYKSWWNETEKTVYIAGRRLLYRPAGQVFTLTVYSNAKSLILLQDGNEVARMASTGEGSGVIWKFTGLKMGEGPTTFTVVSPDGVQDSHTYRPLP